MNPDQEKFYQFVLECVRDEQKGTVKKLMDENFMKQTNGTFTHDDMMKT